MNQPGRSCSLCFHTEECVSYINSPFPLRCINIQRLSKSEMTVVRWFEVIREVGSAATKRYSRRKQTSASSKTLISRVPDLSCLTGLRGSQWWIVSPKRSQ